MQVTVIDESGYDGALFGVGLSYGLTRGMTVREFASAENKENTKSIYHRVKHIATDKLAGKGWGEDKFMRQMFLQLDVNAPRCWWPEADQYRVATTTQSESTMHTIQKLEFVPEMFQNSDGLRDGTIIYLENLRKKYNETKDKAVWRKLIDNLPQSFLQRRIWTMSYANLGNIIKKRRGHRLWEWDEFIKQTMRQIEHPEVLDRFFS